MSKINRAKESALKKLLACAVTGAPPTLDMVNEFAALLRVSLPTTRPDMPMSELQRRFAKLEANNLTLPEGADIYKPKLSTRSVARILGVSPNMVSKWRKHPDYEKWILAEFSRSLTEKLTRTPNETLGVDRRTPYSRKFIASTDEQKLLMLEVFARNYWPKEGPASPPGMPHIVFSTPNEWAQYMLEENLNPFDCLVKPTNDAKPSTRKRGMG
jgi:hypothetical protein